MSKKLTLEEVFFKFKECHGDKYDYSLVKYHKLKDKIDIICKLHGKFEQTSLNHLQGRGCKKCGVEKNRLSNKLTKEEFIAESEKIHGGKYNYELVNYISCFEKVKIVCKLHGEFEQSPTTHLRGQGCWRCGIISCSSKNRLSNEEFVNKAKKIHGNIYDYSCVEYISNREKVSIGCLIHGDLYRQSPSNHLSGKGCPKCGGKVKLTLKEFIGKAEKIHESKYSYKFVDYISARRKVKIVCNLHGYFEQTPSMHLAGQGCPKCGGSIRSNTSEFVDKAIKIHGEKYCYDLVEYTKNCELVKIVCKLHGEFKQTPANHLFGRGCLECGRTISIKAKSTKEEFLDKSASIHFDKYDYSMVEYIGSSEKVYILCKKHKLLFSQTPNSHLRGSGCPICRASHGEMAIWNFLRSKDIEFETQKKFSNCINPKTNIKLRYDFFLNDYNILIEYHGKQHYEEIDWYYTNDSLKERQYRDEVKVSYAKNNNIKLLTISYKDEDKIPILLSGFIT